MVIFHEWEIPMEKKWDEMLESGKSCKKLGYSANFHGF
jgi:hypothetical protein